MKIEIRVKANAKKTEIEKQANGTFVVKVKELAKEGKANAAVVETLAAYFRVPKSSVTILRGLTSRTKFVEIQTAKP